MGFWVLLRERFFPFRGRSNVRDRLFLFFTRGRVRDLVPECCALDRVPCLGFLLLRVRSQVRDRTLRARALDFSGVGIYEIVGPVESRCCIDITSRLGVFQRRALIYL